MTEFLKKSFGESATEEVLGEFRAELGKRFVPKADFNAKRDELARLKEELDGERAKAAEAERLGGELEELREKYEKDVSRLSGEIGQMKEEERISNLIRKSGGRNERAVRALLEGGSEEEISSQLDLLKKSDPYLFNLPEATPSRGNFPRSGARESENLTYSQMLAMERNF